MRFMVMVKSNERSESGQMPDEKMLSAMGVYNAGLIKAGMMLAGDGLQASSKGARVKLAGKKGAAKASVLDGPFAEAKELVGGFWLLQAKSKEDAIEWLERAPFKEGEVEIRQLYELEDFPRDPAEQPGGWRDEEAKAREAATTAPPARKPGTRRYMLLLKADKLSEAGVIPSGEALTRMGALMEEMGKAGVVLGGEGLKPSSKGARIQYAGEKRTVIDGPFTETKELIAGYLILQAASKEEALEWARRWLLVHAEATEGVEESEIEVRLVSELSDFPVNPAEKPDGWRDQEQRFRDEHGQ
jgi:hypothetical protein